MSDGYVTDTAYVAEYYPDHAPAHMNLTCAFNGFRPRPLDEPFTWCDYGCGNGVTANVLAACYPHAQFYGVDFLNTHIRTAETLSLRGGLQNTSFLCKSFTQLEEKDLPPLDFAVMHGVLSWVDEATRSALLEDAVKRLKPGGILLTGYNAMPGWATKLPMRDMIYSLTPDDMNSMDRAEAGLKWLVKLKNANTKYFRDHPALAEAVEQLEKLDLRYMAHEYFNTNLRAFHFAEVRQTMEKAGLKFAGCATLFLNMVDLSVPPDLYEDFRNITSRPELEAKRDFIRNETFRRDVWVKGEPIKTEDEWLKINEDLIFGSLVTAEEMDKEVAFGDVQISYAGEPFDSLIDVITNGAKSIASLEHIPGLDTISAATRVDAARLLSAGGEIIAFAQETDAVAFEGKPKIQIGTAFNRGLVKQFGMVLPRLPLAAPAAGTAIDLSNIDAMLLLAICEKGWDGAVKMVAKVIGSDDGEVILGGRSLSRPEVQAHLNHRIEHIHRKQLAKLLEVGVVALAD
ncbi:MAG: class I SAM-dependent methyltransferase [Rhodospirillaceae bacterium]